MKTYCVESSVCRQQSLVTTCEPPTRLVFLYWKQETGWWNTPTACVLTFVTSVFWVVFPWRKTFRFQIEISHWKLNLCSWVRSRVVMFCLFVFKERKKNVKPLISPRRPDPPVPERTSADRGCWDQGLSVHWAQLQRTRCCYRHVPSAQLFKNLLSRKREGGNATTREQQSQGKPLKGCLYVEGVHRCARLI